MSIDIERVRADTRACEELVHLNNAGASLPPAVVTDAVIEQLHKEEMFGGYEVQFGDAASKLSDAYVSIATLIGGAAHEIAFLDSATRAWQSAVYAMDWKSGDHIITCEAEYPSAIYSYGYLRKRFGVETTYVGDDEHGQVDLDRLVNAITPHTRLITATHIPTYSGLINPAAAIGVIANEAGIPFALDACQSVGHLHLDVSTIGCDILTSAGRKYLRGPRGTGFLWLREGLLSSLKPQFADNFSALWRGGEEFELRQDARRFELFERSTALHLGLGAAAAYANALGTEAIEERIVKLATALRAMLRALPGVQVQDRGESLSGIVTFTVDGRSSEEVSEFLRREKVNTSVSVANYALRSFPQRGLSSVVRASVHYYNTDEELQRLCDLLSKS